MNEQIAAPDFRFQIRATASGGAAQSIQNMNTVPLPNGAFAYAIDTKTLYVLDKSVSSGGAIIPSSGPGRWFVFGVEEGSSGVAMVGSNNFNSFAVDGNWGATTSTNTVLDSVTDTNVWALNTTGCVLTYTGAARKFLVSLDASARVGDATAARDVFLGIGHNSDLTGAPTAGTSGEVDQVIPTATADYAMSTHRVVSMASGDTLRPKMAGPSGAVSLSAMLRMAVTPC